MPERAAELAVGDALHADVFLHLHRIANATVLDFPQRGGGNFAFLLFALALVAVPAASINCPRDWRETALFSGKP